MVAYSLATILLGGYFCFICSAQPNISSISKDIVVALEAIPDCKTARNGAVWKDSVVLGLCGKGYCTLPTHFCSSISNQESLICSEVSPECQVVISHVLSGKGDTSLFAKEKSTAIEDSMKCADINQFCCFWAFYGECDKNPSFMKAKCSKSCGTCHCNEKNKTLCRTQLNMDGCQWISEKQQRLSELRKSAYDGSTTTERCQINGQNKCQYWPIAETPSYPPSPMLQSQHSSSSSQSVDSLVLPARRPSSGRITMTIPAPPSVDLVQKCGTNAQCVTPEYLKPQEGKPLSVECQKASSLCETSYGIKDQEITHAVIPTCPPGKILTGGTCIQYGGQPNPIVEQQLLSQAVPLPIRGPYPRPLPQPMQPYPQPSPQPMQPYPQPSPKPIQPYPQPSPQPMQPYPQPSPQPMQPYPQPLPQPMQLCPQSSLHPMQPCSQPSPQPIRPYPQPMEGSHPQPVERPYPQPVERPYPQPVERPYPQPVERPYPQPIQRPYPQPVERPYPQPVERPYPQPIQRPYPQPAPQLKQKPYPNPAPRPAQTPYSQRVQQTVQRIYPDSASQSIQPYSDQSSNPTPGTTPEANLTPIIQTSIRPYPLPASGQLFSGHVAQSLPNQGIVNCVPGFSGGQSQIGVGGPSSNKITNCVPAPYHASSTNDEVKSSAYMQPENSVDNYYGQRKRSQAVKLTFNHGRLIYQKQ